MENPAKCPHCLQLWNFRLDHLARVHAVHPIGKCVPPVAPEYETDEEEEPTERRAMCVECNKPFNQKRYANAKICGTECRKARRDRKHHESEERTKMKWLLGRAA